MQTKVFPVWIMVADGAMCSVALSELQMGRGIYSKSIEKHGQWILSGIRAPGRTKKLYFPRVS
jgi:hypothetical protein